MRSGKCSIRNRNCGISYWNECIKGIEYRANAFARLCRHRSDPYSLPRARLMLQSLYSSFHRPPNNKTMLTHFRTRTFSHGHVWMEWKVRISRLQEWNTHAAQHKTHSHWTRTNETTATILNEECSTKEKQKIINKRNGMAQFMFDTKTQKTRRQAKSS